MNKNQKEEIIAKKISKLYYTKPISATKIAEKFNIGIGLKDRRAVVWRLLKKYGLKKKRDLSLSAQKLSINERFFEKIDSESKAYFLGLIYADGNISKEPRHLTQINLQSDDSYILDKMKEVMNFSGDVKIYDYKRKKELKPCSRKKCAALNICNKNIYYSLIKLGLFPCKSLTIKFPLFITESGEDIFRHFIRGLFDGDGCLRMAKSYKHKGFDFNINICGNKMFCEGMLESLQKFGIKMNLYHCDESIYCVQIGGNRQVKKIMEWMYDGSTVFLKRKYDRFLILKNQVEKKLSKKTSKYEGVWLDRRSNRFVSSFTYKGKRIFAGHSFISDLDASIARNKLMSKFGSAKK